MILLWLLKPLLALGMVLVRMFPEADVTPLVDAVAPGARVVSWMMKLNEAMPIAELLGAIGIIAGVYGAMYGVMLVRRVVSLFWPGAGS